MKSNALTLIITVLILLAGGYWYVTTQSGNQAPLTGTAPEGGAQTQFQSLVSQLATITFSTDILTDPRFVSLVNLSTPVTPEPAGRLDPFAPLSALTTP